VKSVAYLTFNEMKGSYRNNAEVNAWTVLFDG
jgi:hypothetical protein